MSGNDPSSVVREFQTLFSVGAAGGLTDGQLLERFVTRRDAGGEAAFAALVERHGPMVWGVCRRTLRDPHAAADAFQATFLVLVRRAASVRVEDSLGRWLYGVSRRVATRARVTAGRRSAREVSGVETVAGPAPAPGRSELFAELDEEIARLPERYRAAVVLCDLGGASHEEAARQLGCAVGTVGSRLSRGRERLRDRLNRPELAPINASLAMAMTPRTVAVSMVHATARAASAFEAGRAAIAGMVSAGSVGLASGILRDMMMNRIKRGILSILAAGVIASGTIAWTRPIAAVQGPTGGAGRGGPPAPAVPNAPRPPAGSLFEMRIAADRKHDANAVEGSGYRWVKFDPRDRTSLDDLVTRVDPEKGRMVLVKLDPQNLTERDLLEVRALEDEHGRPAIAFRLTRDGSERLGALTRAHLPEEGGVFKSSMAMIVQGVVVSRPWINAEVREFGILSFGEGTPAEEVARVLGLLRDAAASNAPVTAKAVGDQAAAIREAKAVDLPAMAEANRVAIESAASGSRVILEDRRSVESFRLALRPGEVPPSGGKQAATLSFFRDEELIRKVWVYEGGEWGFERPGTSWTTGADAELWRLVKSKLLK